MRHEPSCLPYWLRYFAFHVVLCVQRRPTVVRSECIRGYTSPIRFAPCAAHLRVLRRSPALGKCYRAMYNRNESSQRTVDYAKRACQGPAAADNIGGRLLSIESEEEYEWFMCYLRKTIGSTEHDGLSAEDIAHLTEYGKKSNGWLKKLSGIDAAENQHYTLLKQLSHATRLVLWACEYTDDTAQQRPAAPWRPNLPERVSRQEETTPSFYHPSVYVSCMIFADVSALRLTVTNVRTQLADQLATDKSRIIQLYISEEAENLLPGQGADRKKRTVTPESNALLSRTNSRGIVAGARHTNVDDKKMTRNRAQHPDQMVWQPSVRTKREAVAGAVAEFEFFILQDYATEVLPVKFQLLEKILTGIIRDLQLDRGAYRLRRMDVTDAGMSGKSKVTFVMTELNKTAGYVSRVSQPTIKEAAEQMRQIIASDSTNIQTVSNQPMPVDTSYLRAVKPYFAISFVIRAATWEGEPQASDLYKKFGEGRWAFRSSQGYRLRHEENPVSHEFVQSFTPMEREWTNAPPTEPTVSSGQITSILVSTVTALAATAAFITNLYKRIKQISQEKAEKADANEQKQKMPDGDSTPATESSDTTLTSGNSSLTKTS